MILCSILTNESRLKELLGVDVRFFKACLEEIKGSSLPVWVSHLAHIEA